MVGVGAADTPPQVAIEAFEATGGAQVAAVPGWMLFLKEDVGHGRAKVTAQGGHSLGWGVAVLLHALEGATQNRAARLGLKDGAEIAIDQII